MHLKLPDAVATEFLGEALADSLPGMSDAAIMTLRGELGAGKTTCVRSLLRRFGVTGLVRSPTYTLVECYEMPAGTFVHVDLYRLRTALEVDDLGLRDYLRPGCLILIEWPEKALGLIPAADLEVSLNYRDEGRQADITSGTALGSSWVGNLGRSASLVPYVIN